MPRGKRLPRVWDTKFEAETYDRAYYEESAKYYDRAIPAFTDWLRGFEPTSIIDVGCGTGAFIEPFVGKIPVMGIDIADDAGYKLPSGAFAQVDMTHPLDPTLAAFRPDLVLSLEVYEHIMPQHDKQFLDNLLGWEPRVLVLGCAKPGQIGRHHYNCQTAEAVKDKVEAYGYRADPEAVVPLLTMRYLATFYRRNTQVFRRI